MKSRNWINTIMAGLVLFTGSAAFAETLNLYTSDDSWVNGNRVEDNYGTLTNMRLRHQNDSWGRNYSLAKFDLSGLPPGIRVDNARIRFYTALGSWPGPTHFAPVAIFNHTQAWDESTVTYANAPTYDGVAIETLDHFGLVGIDEIYFTGTNTINGTGGWLEFQSAGSVALVQGWVDGTIPNHGVGIMATGGFVDDARSFYLQTKENPATSVHPMIVVNYSVASYAEWATGWGINIGLKTDDYDGDGLSNLYEYGLDGDPTNAFDQGTSPEDGIIDMGGTNYFSYIHPQLTASDLTYFLELKTDLHGIWTNDGYSVAGTHVTGGALDFVTNITDTVADEKFIRLIIESPPESLNVKDYGAQGDGSANDTEAILATILAADASDSLAEVFFPAGSYRIGSTNAYALQLENLSNVRLKGEGTNTVLLVSNPENGCLGFTDCTNVAVQGLVVDYDPLPFTQGTITAVDTVGGTFDLLIDPGYPELSEPSFSAANAKWGLKVDLVRNAYDVWAYFSSSWINISDREWRMAADNPSYLQAHPLSIGDRYVHMARRWTAFDIGFDFCRGVELRDITVYASAGLTTGMIHSGGIVIRGLHVGIKPGSTRLLASNGDGIHAAGCVDGLLIEDCSFEGMPDDGINIHGRGGVIISNITDVIKRVGTPRATLFAAGDQVQILNNASGGIRGNALLLKSVQVNSVVWEITLDTPMPDLAADWGTGDKLSNLSRCGQGSIIRNNFFGSHRGRDILLRSHDVIVTNNHFFNPSLASHAVSLQQEYGYYAEGPPAYNVEICGNLFEGGTNQWSWASPKVSTHSYLSGGVQSPSYDSSNVVIEANTFINIDGPAVEATSVRGVHVLNNTVTVDSGIKVASGPTIKLANAEAIRIVDLDIVDSNPSTYAAVHIMNTVSAATDAVTITNLSTALATGSVDIQDDR